MSESRAPNCQPLSQPPDGVMFPVQMNENTLAARIDALGATPTFGFVTPSLPAACPAAMPATCVPCPQGVG